MTATDATTRTDAATRPGTDAAVLPGTGAAGRPAADPGADVDAGPVVLLDEVVPARAPWSTVLPAGSLLTIVDLEGNQAVDFLAYDAHDTSRRYSAPDTIQAQGSIVLTTGSVLLDSEHEPLLTVVADECGRHDTLGGACSPESNALRYGRHTAGQHACAENFLVEGSRHGLTARDLVSNVNWYMNVPVDPDGALGIVDGISRPGLSLTLRAERDVLVLVSNCPQVNNPCNGFDPTPVRMVVTTGDVRAAGDAGRDDTGQGR